MRTQLHFGTLYAGIKSGSPGVPVLLLSACRAASLVSRHAPFRDRPCTSHFSFLVFFSFIPTFCKSSCTTSSRLFSATNSDFCRSVTWAPSTFVHFPSPPLSPSLPPSSLLSFILSIQPASLLPSFQSGTNLWLLVVPSTGLEP